MMVVAVLELNILEFTGKYSLVHFSIHQSIKEIVAENVEILRYGIYH